MNDEQWNQDKRRARAETLLGEMERDVAQYPQAAAEIMLDTADRLKDDGLSEACLDLCARMISEFKGGQDAGYAYSQRIDVLFGLGRDDEAGAEMAALWELDTEARTAAHLISELLAERGDDRAALRWSDRGLADRLRPGTEAESTDTLAGVMEAQWRAGLRKKLGFAPDALDRFTERHDPFRELRSELGIHDPEDEGFAALGLAESVAAVGPADNGSGMPVLSHIVRDDVVAAHTEGLLVGFGDDDINGDDRDAGSVTPETYFREVELDRRKMRSETEFSKGRDVPISLAEIRAFAAEEGIDALTPDVRLGAATAKYDRGGDFPVWPPDRNASCWCASGRKYKKCCGRP
ncbi:SEC-C domain-containing protein [Nocardiopsis mangrovi]|uniref:SEC-C domain-containing protein n=1 Tax=Nocardiopsis mangrovi TaxID=1179818 RepID=A0ABV9DV87_9ACTN